MILSQLLSESLKTFLASLRTQTSVLSNSYGVMLASTLDGTPSGKIGAVDLAKSLNILQVNVLGNGADPNTVKEAGFFQANSWNSNAPTQQSGILIIPFFRDGYWQTQFFVNGQTNPEEIYFRAGTSSSFTRWQKITLDVPSWYSTYANLAALATGIMGQAISSITAQYFQGTVAQAVFDNVFIAVTRLSDNYPLAVKPKDWSSYSSASAYHVDGVLLVSGDKHLVIAPTEANLRWGADADSHAASGNTATSDRDAAMATFDGKARTNTAVQVSEYSSAEVAPGYCHAFTTVTSAYDTTKTAYARRKAGMWWLPSLGEMMMIWSNMTKINQVMSLIGGTPLAETYYWTSTEYSQTHAWLLHLSYGYVGSGSKKYPSRVRPVAAF